MSFPATLEFPHSCEIPPARANVCSMLFLPIEEFRGFVPSGFVVSAVHLGPLADTAVAIFV